MSLLTLSFIQAIILGVLSAIVGLATVLSKRSFFAVALSHGTFPGAVAATILGVPVILGSSFAAVILVFIMAIISNVPRQGKYVASGVVLTFGFALGVLLQAVFVDSNINIESFLIGSIATLNVDSVILSLALLFLVLVFTIVFGKYILVTIAFSQDFKMMGVRVFYFEMLILFFISATIVMQAPIVGVITSIALLVSPAASAKIISSNITVVIFLAIFFGVFSAVGGVLVSYYWNVAAGGSIAVIAGILFIVTKIIYFISMKIRALRRSYGSSSSQYVAT